MKQTADKTPSKIFKKHLDLYPKKFNNVNGLLLDVIFKAMEEYASNELASYKAELREKIEGMRSNFQSAYDLAANEGLDKVLALLEDNPNYTSAIQATLLNNPKLKKGDFDICIKCEGSGETSPDHECNRCCGTGIEDHEDLLEDNPTEK